MILNSKCFWYKVDGERPTHEPVCDAFQRSQTLHLGRNCRVCFLVAFHTHVMIG
jgi:hypothetical protein